MLSQAERNQIIDLINREVVPAIGCTEPIAVALCTARAAETLGGEPEKITVRLSANILKNAMGVGIPGTGMIGLPIAVALGALVGRSEYQLEVLRDVTPEAVERGRRMIDGRRIAICLKEDVDEKLYIEAGRSRRPQGPWRSSPGTYLLRLYVNRDGETPLLDRRTRRRAAGGGRAPDPRAHMGFRHDLAAGRTALNPRNQPLNKAAAGTLLRGREFRSLRGPHICCDRERKVMGDSIFTRILSYTSAACDARMAGAMIPVMSNSGSGNRGIAATRCPWWSTPRRRTPRRQMKIRALTLSHLTVIYIKQSLGRLSALCGCVVAATGSSCGITYLMGGGYGQAAAAVKNMIASLTGMICDRPSSYCGEAHERRLDGRAVGHDGHGRPLRHPVEGIIEEDADRVSATSTAIGRDGMNKGPTASYSGL